VPSSKSTPSRRAADPYAAREARKYENPIPSRELILETLHELGGPRNFRELAEALEIESDEDLEAFRRRLNAMERDGQLVRNRRGGFCPVNKKDLIAGRVIAHPDGFGFLKPDEEGDDLFLAPREMRTLWHDDRAVVRVSGVDRRGRREAALVEVIERNTHQVVGRLFREAGIGFVVPDHKRQHHDVVIPDDALDGARDGQMVVARIIEQPGRRNRAVGQVIEVLGDHMGPGMEIDVVLRTYELPDAWPDEVGAEIAGLGGEVEKSAKEGRVDLRHLPLVTIDGEDARDFDDAVCCAPTPKGWRLLVSIADVSSYVKPGTALDEEARTRGNSVYFPDRVIPMLPEVLSNGLCSLNPQVDRLCMTCELLIDRDGKVLRSRFFEAVMRSHARLTYTQVAAMLVDRNSTLRRQHAQLVPHLEELYALYKVLLAGREARGAIDFESTETRIIFNENKKVERIVPVQRNDAHRLIEECMLAANLAAARRLLRRRQPALYRVHEGPTDEKLEGLREFLGEVGLQLGGGENPQAKDYARLLERAKGRPDAHLIQTVMLRSLAQAIYSAENLGHFGLAYDAYTHFTSPIRRYPDLVVHRALKHLLADGKPAEFEYGHGQLQSLGEHCSATERRADEVTREVVDWLKCEYMMGREGEEFSGVISGVTSFGLFVELDGIYIDGLLHITSLERDYFHFDPVHHRLTGERTGMTYRLGDPIRVRLASVNLDERKIDFVLPEGAAREPRSARRGGSPYRRSRRPRRRASESEAVEQAPSLDIVSDESVSRAGKGGRKAKRGKVRATEAKAAKSKSRKGGSKTAKKKAAKLKKSKK
jgi:ribonuclease R